MRRFLALGGALGALVAVSSSLCVAQMRVDVEAYRGQPFGVGRVTLQSGGDFRINLPRVGGPNRRGRILDLARRIADKAAGPLETMSLETGEMTLVERSGRIFYPVFEKRERPILKEFVNVPKQVTAYFLFQGDAPLEVTLYTPVPQTGSIVPRRDPQGYARLRQLWWRDYSAAADARTTPREFSPMVEEYLIDTLARRLQLPLAARPPTRATSIFRSELNLLIGSETARQEAAREILLADGPPQTASELLPEQLPPPKPEVLNPSDAPVESLASRVPIECFYVRFGSFAKVLWLQRRLEEWGGEIRDIISERGYDYGINQQIQRQLGLRQSKTAELFGGSVIADVAMIGTDTFVREGAALGILFEAKNSLALAADFTQQRAAIVKETSGAKLESLKIAGRPVSLISTPDNALRSFYATDGEFHLITTSRAITEWFLATGRGDHESLGESEAFRLARKHMPLERNDTVFAYFSPDFFQNLLGAHYQIELQRRLRSTVEMELLRIARLAAAGEGRAATTVAELIAAGFLPPGFGRRVDQSRLMVEDDAMFDSMRGARGTFLPVPDVEITRVTPRELDHYRQFAESYESAWGTMDPIVAGIRREALPEGKLERVTIDAKAAPLSEQHTQILSQWLGPPTNQRLAPIEGDVVAFEAVMRGGSFFDGEEHHLFGALRDADPAIALDPRDGLIPRILTAQWQGLQGYLGAWPNPGFLQLLNPLIETAADPAGYSRSLAGLWRRQFGDFTLVSFHPQILADVSQQLRFEEAPRPAQIWIRADDLAHSNLAGFINAFGYRQSRQIALGNSRFMNMLVEQLHVPPADAMNTAERLLDARLLEPLGGKYELRELQPGGPKSWISTSIVDHSDTAPPADYLFPALAWFRGVELEVMTEGGLLALHGEVIMPAKTETAGFKLPELPFSLPSFGGKQDESKSKPKSGEELPAPKPTGKRAL